MERAFLLDQPAVGAGLDWLALGCQTQVEPDRAMTEEGEAQDVQGFVFPGE
jgi:hypothetical protein